jgi:hypothetical protein
VVSRRWLGLVSVMLASACNRCDAPPDAGKDASTAALADASTAGDASAKDASPQDGSPHDASPPVEAAVSSPTDAGPSACRLVWGPAEQPFHGPGVLAAAASELRVVANDDGKPHVFPIALTPPPRAPVDVPPAPDSFLTTRWPPCAIAGKWVYCQSKAGAITRTTLGAADTKEIAKGQGGTRISAAPLGADHAVVAFHETHKTSEGDMLQAYAALDDGEPVRLSDDGAGANVVHLVAHGDGATAVYLDARSAMLPVHARTVHARGKELALGVDTVLFVAGPPERGIDFTVATSASKSFVLLPMAKETTEFGVATIALADPPRADVGASWSLYPNGLDPSPIAASGPYVVRLRPLDASPHAGRVVELGRIDDKGAFASLGSIAEGPGVAHLAIATDSFGALWILYADAAHTWLERRVCP